MRFLKRFFARIRNLVVGPSGDRRLREEVEEHLALQTEENLRSGMAPAEARRHAVLKFGATETVREQYHAEQGMPWIETVLQDLRHALRLIARSPGFAAIVILTMALGIGATTAIFSVVDATLLHPLPYPHPEQLVRIEDDLPGIGARDVGVSIPEWHDLERSGIFQYVSLIGGGSVNLTGSSQPERILFLAVTPNYMAMLGAKPQLGRSFDPNDKTPGFTLDVLISDGLWKRAFASNPHILGRNLRLDNDLYRVIGVMHAGFRDPGRTPEQRSTELWAASNFSADPAPPPMRGTRLGPDINARLSPGLSVAAAQSRLDALVAALQRQYPANYPAQLRWTVRLIPLQESVVGGVRQSLSLLLGAVGLVLLIGCVNVANLLLARASARGREIAIRQALGAARTRLVRQLLTENLLLCLLGGLGGLGILFAARGMLLHLIPESLPHINEISLNWSVLIFAAAVTLAAGVIFGLAPAWQASRLDVNHALRQEGRGSKGSMVRTRTRGALVATEFALSLVLSIAAGLLLRSFWRLYQVQLGFNPRHVMSVQTWLPIPNDPRTDIYGTATQEATLLRAVLSRVQKLPGVEESAVGDLAALPLGHGRSDLNPRPFIREGRDTPATQAPLIDVSIVSPDYFHILGLSLLRGRNFSDQDLETTPPVAIVNEAMARAWWPGEDPVGMRFNLNPAKPSWITVIGVVANARTESIAEPGISQIYLSVFQRKAKDLAIFLRGQLDPAAICADVREQVQAVDPQLPVFAAQTLDDVLSASLAGRRFSLELVAAFAVTALLLAGLGVYGVISFLVNERSLEIGIRLALGATRGEILRMVLGQGIRLALAGAATGLAASLVVSRLMSGVLYGVRPADPLTFVAVTAVLTVIALAACYLPAWRATRVDPLVALRYE